MLDANSSILAHCAQNLGLVLLSFVFLPVTSVIVASCLFYNRLFEQVERGRTLVDDKNGSLKSNGGDGEKGQRKGSAAVAQQQRQEQQQQQRTILVTGVSMTKGLALARLFNQAGHRVIGADFEPRGLPLSSGRVSKAVDKFYRLDKPSSSTTNDTTTEKLNPYVQSLLSIVVQEHVDLWVSCSGVASAIEDGEAKTVIESRTNCKAIQFDVETTKMLHEKHSFIARAKELGLNVPDTHTVTSVEQVQKVLFGGGDDGSHNDNGDGDGKTKEETTKTTKKYIMKTIDMDDANRGDMTLLPKSTDQETMAHLSRLIIDHAHPWIMQQFIPGQQEFCTHALVIRGRVRVFVACPSAELLMHYEALPTDSSLSRSMLAFTRTFAEKSGDDFTGHLSFDFLVEEEELRRVREEEEEAKGATTDVELWPIECNPRAHTAVVLFNDTISMVDAYMSLLDDRPASTTTTSSVMPGKGLTPLVTPVHSSRYKYFWLPHDLVAYLILPVYQYLTSQNALGDCYASVSAFVSRTLPLLFTPSRATWHDGTFVFWDPMPAWWLWHVQWPGMFLISLYDLVLQNFGRHAQQEAGGKDRKSTAGMWSRVNVSTGKMFGC